MTQEKRFLIRGLKTWFDIVFFLVGFFVRGVEYKAHATPSLMRLTLYVVIIGSVFYWARATLDGWFRSLTWAAALVWVAGVIQRWSTPHVSESEPDMGELDEA